MVDRARIHKLNTKGINGNGPAIYWMSRDQRTSDSWALLYAMEQVNQLNRPLVVVFALAPSFGNANLRHYSFMLNGLIELEQTLEDMGVGFYLLMGDPTETIPTLANELKACLVVSDFDPLRIKRKWAQEISSKLRIAHHEVDAHNIVPCRVASPKQEFGAYTLRPKLNKLLNHYLTDFPQLPKQKIRFKADATSWSDVLKWLNPCNTVRPVDWLMPGEGAAKTALKDFIDRRLEGYSTSRNNPLVDGQSNLSPYLHYGQLAAQRVAIEVSRSLAPAIDKSAFLEELIVRRELSDNFCFYNSHYDTSDGFHAWAKETHNLHRNDEREYTYSTHQLENGTTHDPLWNAAQREMINTGKLHGYMRMYWAKKILEWTSSPELAMEIAIRLNDKYSLDGRDPNGYAGIAWSIGGVHDRAWSERPIFGKIRYMNYNGCKRKFDVEGYINRNKQLL